MHLCLPLTYQDHRLGLPCVDAPFKIVIATLLVNLDSSIAGEAAGLFACDSLVVGRSFRYKETTTPGWE